jgi:hypothetical protein
MLAEPATDFRFEIGPLLFTDIVGYFEVSLPPAAERYHFGLAVLFSSSVVIYPSAERRNVYKVSIAYAIVAQPAMQIAKQVFHFSKFRMGQSGWSSSAYRLTHSDKYLPAPREAYRAIAPPSVCLNAWANSLPVWRAPITNVLFSPSVDQGPRGTSLNSTKRQSVTSVSPNPR